MSSKRPNMLTKYWMIMISCLMHQSIHIAYLNVPQFYSTPSTESYTSIPRYKKIKRAAKMTTHFTCKRQGNNRDKGEIL